MADSYVRSYCVIILILETRTLSLFCNERNKYGDVVISNKIVP